MNDNLANCNSSCGLRLIVLQVTRLKEEMEQLKIQLREARGAGGEESAIVLVRTPWVCQPNEGPCA